MAAITAAVIGTAGAMYAAKKSSDAAKDQAALGREAIEASDPFRQYRPQYATQLNALMSDPSSIANTPEYKARQQAAARQLAAQGYTGSGNAIIEAATAGGESYQQAFNNLAMLSGAAATPGGGYSSAIQGNAAANDNYLSSLSGVANNLANTALTIGQKFNQPAPTTTNTAVGTGPA